MLSLALVNDSWPNIFFLCLPFATGFPLIYIALRSWWIFFFSLRLHSFVGRRRHVCRLLNFDVKQPWRNIHKLLFLDYTRCSVVEQSLVTGQKLQAICRMRFATLSQVTYRVFQCRVDIIGIVICELTKIIK